MKERVNNDHEALFAGVMSDIMNILETLSSQERIMIGLSGGRSTLGLYKILVPQLSSISTSLRAKLRFCLLDERLVESNHPDRNGKLLHEVLFHDLFRFGILTPGQFLEPDFSQEHFLEDYSRLVDSIDIALFGVGEDGHIASLFPEHAGLEYVTKGYFFMSDSPKPPSKRISVSKTMISKIKHSFVFFIGNSKISAYQHFQSVQAYTPKLPVSLFHEISKVVIVRDFE